MRDASDLGWLQRQAQVLLAAKRRGHLTDAEYARWRAELIEPVGFWARLSWKVFGI